MDDMATQTAAEFEIEEIFPLGNHGTFVVARLSSDTASFTLSENPRLGEVPLVRWVEIPSRFDADGQPVPNCFVFQLKSPEDESRLQVGQRTVLE
jgi:hypothetical protein